MSSLTPAEHRALRELYATAQRLHDHWSKLAAALADGPAASVLRGGAGEARELLRELRGRTAPHGLYGRPAARGGGRALGRLNSAADHTLERNQALRLAALDATHVALLLAYLERLARVREDDELAQFHAGWAERMCATEGAARAAAIELGAEPEDAVAPAHPSAAGRAGHALALGLGTIGEWVDRRSASPR